MNAQNTPICFSNSNGLNDLSPTANEQPKAARSQVGTVPELFG